MSECYRRRGMIYQGQACRVDSMRGHVQEMLKVWRSHKLRQWWVATPRYSVSQLFGLFRDGAELGETCLHGKRVFQDMLLVMVRQWVFMAASWQSNTVLFQG